jgi:hypothetical protein
MSFTSFSAVFYGPRRLLQLWVSLMPPFRFTACSARQLVSRGRRTLAQAALRLSVWSLWRTRTELKSTSMRTARSRFRGRSRRNSGLLLCFLARRVSRSIPRKITRRRTLLALRRIMLRQTEWVSFALQKAHPYVYIF